MREQARPFFLYARERQSILTRRISGAPRPWTEDAVLDTYRFCNVYREDDATTQWFRKWVREPLRSSPEVLLATVLFRWFNRITTGDAIFRQLGDYTDGRGTIRTAFQQFLDDGRSESIRTAIRQHVGTQGPYVTGAYIIKTPDGLSKLDGVLRCVEWFNVRCATLAEKKHEAVVNWRGAADWMIGSPGRVSLEQCWDWLRKFPYLGDFMAYEIVTDLRHTDLLSRAPDIYTWANPGPGAMRGLNRIHGRKLDHKQPKYVFVCEMRQLLEMVSDERSEAHDIWPGRIGHDVEMRDIEHTLCEFDKYERARLGEGRPRGTYKR